MGTNFPGDEPLTPAGRLFLQPEMSTIIHVAMGVKNPIDIDSLKSAAKNSLMLKQPRFSSLLIRDENGRERWRKTEIDFDRHFILVESKNDDDDDVEQTINDYIADLSLSTPLSSDKPLWEIHLMLEQQCLILRIHHALGDGIALMSMFLADCRKLEDPEALPDLGGASRGRGGFRDGKGKNWGGILREVLKIVWFSLVFCLEFVLRCLWVFDRKTVISGGDGVELWPRKVATAKFLIDDMKLVKNAVVNSTINDVLLGVISVGLSKYLDHHSPNSMKEGQQLTGVAMVNLREQPGLQLTETMNINSNSRWGNKFGMLLLPTYYHKGIEPLQYVKNAQKMTDRKKKTLEAPFSYQLGNLIMSWLGPRVATLLFYRITCNTTYTISNVLGPQDKITLASNPITFIRVNTSSLPQGIAMHMVSYAGRADMQIVVAKDIVPDPEFLAKCFEDSLLEMKQAVKTSDKYIIIHC